MDARNLASRKSAELSPSTLESGSGRKLWGLATGPLKDAFGFLVDMLDALSTGAGDGYDVAFSLC